MKFMNKKELYNLLNSEMYQRDYTKTITKPKSIDSESILTVFDELIEKLDRLPTCEDYVEECLKRTEKEVKELTLREKNKRKKHRTEKKLVMRWNKKTINMIRNASEIAYTSLLMEQVAAIQLKFLYPEATVVMSSSIDHTFGSDIVLYLNNKVCYLHIMASTESSEASYYTKSNRPGVARSRSGIIHYFKRDWSKAHVQLKYKRKNSNSTKILNGNIIFRESYLKSVVDQAFSDSSKHEKTDNKANKTSLERFFDWCKMRDIDYKKYMIVL